MGLFDSITSGLQNTFDTMVGAVTDPFGTITGTRGIREGMETQAEAYQRATGITKEMYEKTKDDLLLMLAPALERYNQSIKDSIGEIRAGRDNVISTFNSSTDRAYQLLNQSGADAKKIIMGAQAGLSGTPRRTFESEYQQIKNMPVGSYQAFQNVYRRTTGSSPTGIRARPTESDYIGEPKTSPPDTGPRGGGGYVKEDRLEPEGRTGAGGRPVSGTGGVQPPPPGTGESQPPPQNMQDLLSSIGGTPYEQEIYSPRAKLPLDFGGYQPPAGQVGFGPAKEALEAGYGRAAGFMERGIGTARDDVYRGLEGALERSGLARDELTGVEERGLEEYRPYSEAGRSAIDMEAALSGALGADRQQEAIDAYIESPGQKYLREQQEKALLRSSAAIGGLGGGRVRTALQKQAMDIASTQQQQHLENLRSLAMRGQATAGERTALMQAMGAGRAGIYGHEAEMISQAENVRADLARQLGLSQADLARMSSQDIAGLAERTGLNIANIEQQTAAQKAALLQALGQNVAGTQGAASTNISNLLAQGGAGALTAGQNIGQILANLATGQGSNLANIAIGQGQSTAAGQAAIGQSQSNLIQSILGLAALRG